MTKPGSVSDEIVELVDIFPTLKELCGMPEQNQKLAGQSLVPLLKSSPESWKEKPAITQVRRGKNENAVMGYSVRTEDYRYNEWWTETENPELVASELYDLKGDPEEEVNLADNENYNKECEKLSKLLKDYRKP